MSLPHARSVATEGDVELRGWLESLDFVLQERGRERAEEILRRLRQHASQAGVTLSFTANTPYVNTIPASEQPPYPGSQEIERRIKSFARWNALAMVVRANRLESGIGGHISTYGSAATLYEVGFNHFFRARNEDGAEQNQKERKEEGSAEASAREASVEEAAEKGREAVSAGVREEIAESERRTETKTPPAESAPARTARAEAKPEKRPPARREREGEERREEPKADRAEVRAEAESPAEAETAADAPSEDTVIPFCAEIPEQARRPSHLAAASPTIRRFARELGVDINQVKGTGPEGRIDEEDVKGYAREIISGAGSGRLPARASSALPDFSKWGEVERKPMSSVRRSTAEHLAQAWQNVPQVTQFDSADITELEILRSHFADAQSGRAPKITVTAIALKVAAAALQKFPQFAASIDMANQEIVYKRYRNIGVAVDTSHGLLVPVVRDVDRKSIPRLARELTELSEKARAKKLALEEMAGGVFTITNLGGIGGTAFSPIVNYPEVAILGISRLSVEPRLVKGNTTFEPRKILLLSLSYDHRLIDGADGARFLRWIAEALEQPASLLFTD